MLQQELETLPRGVGRRLQMKPTTSATDDIAGVLKNQYETNTAPGILPGLSGICFIRFFFNQNSLMLERFCLVFALMIA